MSAPTSNPTPAPQQGAVAPAATGPRPSLQALVNAAKIAIEQDRPIQLDYYVDSATKKAFMGKDTETNEKMLVKSHEEFTSLVQKVYKVAEDYIVLTENSLYIVSGNIETRRIQASALRGY